MSLKLQILFFINTLQLNLLRVVINLLLLAYNTRKRITLLVAMRVAQILQQFHEIIGSVGR